MAWMLGSGPFGDRPGGHFNIPVDTGGGVLYFEDNPRRIRVIFAKEVVVDSQRVKLLHESGRLPVYYFPPDDVRQDLLEPSERTEESPIKGTARFWSVRVGDRLAPDAAWSWTEPLLDGHVALDWNSMDEWFAEDDQLFGHPRDPYSRIDVHKSTRHVRVLRHGVVLADTRRSKILFETGLPPRHYIPAEDVRTQLHEDPLRIQGIGVALVGPGRRPSCGRPGLVLPGTPARCRADPGPALLLPGAGRPRGRRPGTDATANAMVAGRRGLRHHVVVRMWCSSTASPVAVQRASLAIPSRSSNWSTSSCPVSSARSS
jgi:uncharacterized protein (DUF427 family)